MPALKITLGPVKCIACRRFVALVGGQWRNVVPERQKTYYGKRVGDIHRCEALIHRANWAKVDKVLASIVRGRLGSAT